MILRRLGNKSKMAAKILPFFPPHRIYIEPFFGAGGMFFNKPKAKYNIVNDIDSDVYNLFMVVMNQKEELEKAFYMMPIHSDLLEYWKKNIETDPIKKALRFLFLSNYLLHGNDGSMRSNVVENPKREVVNYLKKTYELINDVKFFNKDYRDFISCLAYRPNSTEIENSFIYSDPPYIETSDNYSNSFTEQDSADLFNCLQATGCKWAMSEFDNPFIINQTKERGLNIEYLGERQNLKNRRTEILIMNYSKSQLTIFD